MRPGAAPALGWELAAGLVDDRQLSHALVDLVG